MKYIYSVGDTASQVVEFQFHRNQVTLTYFTDKNISNYFCGHQDQAFKFGTTIYKLLFIPNLIFEIWAIIFARFGFSEFFCTSFFMFLDINLKLGIDIRWQYDFQSSVVVLTCLRPEVCQAHLSESMGIN